MQGDDARARGFDLGAGEALEEHPVSCQCFLSSSANADDPVNAAALQLEGSANAASIVITGCPLSRA
jgi:hypothetical protein